MRKLVAERGRIRITMEAVEAGADLCVVIYGGERPHIGCITLSVPRPSLKDAAANSATTSVLNVTGHKDDEAARYVSHTLSARLQKNVAVACGIHIDRITDEEIGTVLVLLEDLTEKMCGIC